MMPIIDAFARLHAGLFNATPEATRESAVYRAQAAAVVERISDRYSSDEAADWERVEVYLRLAYERLEAEAEAARA